MRENSTMDVVIGTGPLGLAVARELLSKGKQVRVINRSGKADVPANVEIRSGDITHPESVRDACRGAQSIYLCAKPPYTQMATHFQPIMDGAIEAASSSGAKLIYADSLYAWGPFTGALTEKMPYAATGPKGMTRARIATQLLAAHREGKVQAAIGCASDFYGPGVLDSAVGERVFANALAGKAASVLGNIDMPHTYIFIEDYARGLVTLGEHAEALGQAWLLPSAETITTREFVTLVYDQAGKPVKLLIASRWLVSLMGIFNPMMRELPEIMYQSEKPFVVDHGKFAKAFGVSVTPHREAIGKTLEWYRKRANQMQEKK